MWPTIDQVAVSDERIVSDRISSQVPQVYARRSSHPKRSFSYRW